MALALTHYENTEIISAMSVDANDDIHWASAEGETPIDAGADEFYTVVNIQVSVTFHASSAEDAIVHTRKSTDGGTTKDTEEEGTYQGTIPCTADTTITKTFTVHDFTYLDVGVESADAGTYNITVNAQYDGYKITGMD